MKEQIQETYRKKLNERKKYEMKKRIIYLRCYTQCFASIRNHSEISQKSRPRSALVIALTSIGVSRSRAYI